MSARLPAAAGAGGAATAKKRQAEFLKDCRALVLKVLDPLCADMEKFTQMFDYRADKDAPEFQAAKDAIERADGFLNGRI